MAINWTEEQKAIFDCNGKNILVSASAGSGKTTVMIQKIIELVLKENDRTQISKFLVVTFTKASAVDMKAKLVEAFSSYGDDEFCLKQIDEIDTSDISNLHSFCSRLISSWFFEVNIDPSFQVLDGAVAGFLQDKALQKLFERKEKQADKNYLWLYDIFQKKRQNKPLKTIIKRFNNFLNSNLNSEDWFYKTIESAYQTDLSQNPCACLINSYVPKHMQKLANGVEKFANFCLKNKQDKLYDYFIEVAGLIRTVNVNNSFEVNAKNISEIKIPKAPVVSSKVEIKPQVDEMKKQVKRELENFQKNYISSDVEYLKEGLTKTKQVIIELYKLVQEFNEIYSEMKREINGLDFNDLEKNALKILQNPEILDSLRKKYRYVFVDEYQDINSVQEEIISLVSGKNNRFMVGDIKQSIYRFRLCDPDIFMEKYEKYSKGDENSELFKLNCNFRSDKKILRFVDEVFSGVMTEDFGGIDYEKDSKFIAGENNLDNPNSVNLIFVDMEKQEKPDFVPSGVYSVKNHQQTEIDDEEKGFMEAKVVASTIKSIIDEVGYDNFKFSDVAVLVGSRNSMVAKFIETLKSFGIKVSSDEKFNLIDEVYVQEILNFVRLACNKNDDFLLFKVLKSRLFNFGDEDLVNLRLLDPKIRFFECLDLSQNLADEKLRKKVNDFKFDLEKYTKLARILSVKKLCKKIVDEFSIYQINSITENGESKNYNIDLMIEALPETDCFDFVLNYSDFSLEVENECGGDTVSVMTIHKSKGIEFKYVFLINTTNEFNFESTYEDVIFNKDFGVGVDYYDLVQRTQMPTIASSGIKLLEKRKLVEEQQRVLYVALTRAKEKLFVLCSKESEKISATQKEHKKCFADWFEQVIYSELHGKHNPLINFVSYSSSELAKREVEDKKVLHFKDVQTDEPSWFKYPYDDAKKFPLKTSISKILKVSEEETEFVGTGSSADRGTAYHDFMQIINFKAGDLDSQIEKIGESDDVKEKVDLNLIKKIVKLSIFEEIAGANYILTEREFYSKLPTAEIASSNADAECVLQGIIDLIAIFDDHLIVLDYKTGKCSNDKMKGYGFQLNTYAKIAEKIYEKPVSKKILCFIDEQKIIEI